MPENEGTAKISADSLSEAITKAFKADDETLDKVVDRLAKKMTSSEELRDEFLGKVKEFGGEVERDKVADVFDQTKHQMNKLSGEEQRLLMKKGLLGETSGQTAKEIRDKDPKRFFGDYQKNLKRTHEGRKYKNCKATRVFAGVMQCFSEGIAGHKVWDALQTKAKNKGWDDIAKDLESGDFGAGGSLVPEPLAEEIIEFNYANSVIRQFPVRTLNLATGSLDFGNVTATTTAHWTGETEAQNASELTSGKKRLEANKLIVTTIVSNDLVRQAPDGMMQIIEDDMRAVADLKQDIGLIRGDGNNGAPLGLRNQIDSNNVIDWDSNYQSGTSSKKTEIWQGLVDAKNKVETNDIPTDNGNAGWIMHPRTKNGVIAQSGDDDMYAELVVAAVMNGNILGAPIETTTQLPTDLGGSNDGTEAYYVQFDQVILGDTLNLRLSQSDAATVLDSSGNDYKTFARDATAIRAIQEVDVLLRHTGAGTVLDQIDVGSDAFA